MVKDSLITTIAALANQAPDDFNAEVTLLVGGFLVSGEVMSYREYCAENPISKTWLKGLEQSNASDSQSNEATAETVNPQITDDLPNFIHLRNAQFFSGSGNAIPGNGVSVRILISSVHSLSFGRLSV